MIVTMSTNTVVVFRGSAPKNSLIVEIIDLTYTVPRTRLQQQIAIAAVALIKRAAMTIQMHLYGY
jgi:hypothetical protein